MKTMKKLWMAAAWTAAFVLASCQEESFEGRPDSDNYYASVETFGTGTNTELGEGRSVIWSLEDRIAIFEGNGAGQAYQVLDSYIGKSSGEFAEVEGLVTEGTGAAFDGTVAVYPFNEDLSVTSGANGDYIIEGISFPSEQKYIAGSFSDEAFPMTAICENGNRTLSFKNIGGVLKLSLTGNNSVSQITLTGNSGEPLSGSATVTLGSDDIPSVTMSDDASTSVSLICDPAVQLDPETATDFYISIPPTDFEVGFKATILDVEGKEHGLATHKTNPAERSSILAMPESTPESLDDIELTADTFCSVDFVEGWTETRFGGDGTIVFIKEDDMGRMTHSLMLLPNDETVLMPVYIRFDENEVPSYMSFMNTEIYINGYTDSTVDFTLAVEDAVWSVKDVPCNELQFFSPTTRSWKDNNGIRNVCALGNIIVGSVDVVLGAVLIGGSLIIEGGSVGLATPAAVPTIAAAIIEIGSGLNTIYDGSNTLFGPADQKRDSYATAMFVNGGLEVLSEFLQSMEVTGNEIIVKFPRELDPKGKVGLASFILGMGFTTIDELWGETYTGPVNLAQVHQDVKVVTGRADNITKDSAELYGYVSPLATAPFGYRIVTEIYIVVWKAGDENNKQNRSIFNSDGGIVSFTFTGLEPDTEYCYQTIFEDCSNKKYRFGEVNTFKTKGEPYCITGTTSSITNNSAVVDCTYCNVPEDGQCQVMLSWDDGYRDEGYKIVEVENREGTQSITLSGLRPKTTYSYCASIYYEGGQVKDEVKKFTTKGYEERWVDLGLSVLWAAYNVGASSPEEYGGYYAWGETETKSEYSFATYKHRERTDSDHFHICDDCLCWDYKYIGSDISGTSYDVAHVKWGGGARMPTLEEVKELVNNCTFRYGTYNGVEGDYVTGPNGNSIFLPFTGFRYYDDLREEGYYGDFWSGTYDDDYGYGYCAFDLYCFKDTFDWFSLAREYGRSVRPVTEK